MESQDNGTIEVPAVEEPKPAKAKKQKRSKAEVGQALTLADLAERYLEHLDAEGRSQGTLFSYSIELKTAQRELGAETRMHGRRGRWPTISRRKRPII